MYARCMHELLPLKRGPQLAITDHAHRGCPSRPRSSPRGRDSGTDSADGVRWLAGGPLVGSTVGSVFLVGPASGGLPFLMFPAPMEKLSAIEC